MSVIRLNKHTPPDISKLGGKGANLAKLLSLGCRIPDCIAISHEHPTARILEDVLPMWEELNFQLAAVRSSATAEDATDQSFAGMFSTYLYVSKDKLLEKIELCRVSLSLPRVADYITRMSISKEDVHVNVLVQRMIEADASGVCFTKNPLTNVSDEIVIEAIHGQGELLVSGQVTPDYYRVAKYKNVLLEKNISTQEIILDKKSRSIRPRERELQHIPKISEPMLYLLREQAVSIENMYQKPVDIEWAVENGVLYILQARPITT